MVEPNDDIDLIRVVTTDGVRDEEVSDEGVRSVAGRHLAAIRTYLQTGSTDRLREFEDVTIAGRQLETDPDVVDALDDSGELEGDLYPTRRADWR